MFDDDVEGRRRASGHAFGRRMVMALACDDLDEVDHLAQWVTGDIADYLITMISRITRILLLTHLQAGCSRRRIAAFVTNLRLDHCKVNRIPFEENFSYVEACVSVHGQIPDLSPDDSMLLAFAIIQQVAAESEFVLPNIGGFCNDVIDGLNAYYRQLNQ